MSPPDPPSLQRRSSLVMDFIGRLKSGTRFKFDNSPVFYNVLTFVVVLIVTVTIWGAYIILHPFLVPLLWAFLCGSVLHPFKYQVSTKLREWILMSDTPNIFPVFVELTCFPLFFLINFSDFVKNLAVKYCWPLISMIFVICLFFFTPEFCISAFWSSLYTFIYCITSVMDIFSSGLLLFTMVTCVILSAVFLRSIDQRVLTILSIITWVAIACYFSSIFGFMKLPVFFFISSVAISGYIFGGFPGGIHSNDERTDNSDENEKSNNENVRRSPGRSRFLLRQSSEMYDAKHPGDVYIYWVATACFITLLIKFWWTPFVLTLLLVTFIIRKMCNLLGIQRVVEIKLTQLNDAVVVWFESSEAKILFPSPVMNMYKMIQTMKQKILSGLMKSVDCISTIIVILAVIFFLSIGFIFLTSQVYMEGVYLVKVSGKVVNDTMLYNPNMVHIFPKNWREHLDSAINNAYLYGREFISNMIKKMAHDVNDAKLEELELIVLELWDRIYQAWFVGPYEDVVEGPKVTSEAVYQIWYRLTHFTSPGKVGTTTMVEFVKNNMTLFLSTLSSVWEFVKDNAGLALYLLETVLSIILISGFAVFTFFIDVVVFLTALFYLLSSSGKYYKPVEFIRDVSPSYGTTFALAMERSVTEVFMVSLKLATFYGLYTWLIHNLFHMHIVYIPTALAMIFAAVPFVCTYWVCLPGVLDLWLVQGNYLGAICLFLLQFGPTSIVDTTIYEDIHGGHPYLTGLSMAGGVICFGIQGAIIGPLILCCMFVIVKFCTALMKEPDRKG